MDNHFSDNLIDQLKEDPNNNYFTNVLIETIKISKVPKKTLDVGCGNGVFTEILKKQFKSELVGVDGNQHGLDVCEKRGFDKTFLIKDFSKDKLSMIEDLDYDLAISKDVLEHIINPEHAIKEIWKKIKKGGFFLLHVPNHFPFFGRLKFLFKNNIDTFNYFPDCSRNNFPHIRFYTYNSVLQLFSKYNFKIIKNFSTNFFVFPIINKIINKKLKEKLVLNYPDHFSEAYTLLIKKI